jgi:hypothetical protein
MKLSFQNTVKSPHLLFLTKLQTVLGRASISPLTMLAWWEVTRWRPLHNRALLAIAAGPLQIKFHTLTPAQPA